MWRHRGRVSEEMDGGRTCETEVHEETEREHWRRRRQWRSKKSQRGERGEGATCQLACSRVNNKWNGWRSRALRFHCDHCFIASSPRGQEGAIVFICSISCRVYSTHPSLCLVVTSYIYLLAILLLSSSHISVALSRCTICPSLERQCVRGNEMSLIEWMMN